MRTRDRLTRATVVSFAFIFGAALWQHFAPLDRLTSRDQASSHTLAGKAAPMSRDKTDETPTVKAHAPTAPRRTDDTV